MTLEASPDPDLAAPAGKKARTRQTILLAAGELFADRGITTTTVETIAAAADVSVGSVYKHFGSKDALALAFISESLFALARGVMRRASAHARMFPGEAETWPDDGGDWPEYHGYSPAPA